MLELLVASMCIGNYNCDYATKAYLSFNQAPQQWAARQTKRTERQAIALIGRTATIGITTVASMIAKKTYQVRIGNNFSIGKTAEGMLLLYAVNF